MATFEDFGKKYAEELGVAAARDRAAGRRPRSAGAVRGTDLYETLRRIDRDLDGLRTGGRPLTEDEKETILDVTAEELQYGSGQVHRDATKAASNDDLGDLIDYVEDMTR